MIKPIMINRRTFLSSSSAAMLVTMTEGVWFTASSGRLLPADRSAYEAWQTWSVDGEPKPLKLVRAAILASSPHNTQPWRFRVADSFIELYIDTSRKVSGLDPFLREAHIGMGCALENLLLAAHAYGFSTTITLAKGPLDPAVSADSAATPTGGPSNPLLQRVARVDLSPATASGSAIPDQPDNFHELYSAIPNRHTNRSIYDPTKELPASFAAELLSLSNRDEDARLFLFTASQDRNALRNSLIEISAAANLELYSDPHVEQGSEQWIRWRSRDAQKFKDGLVIDTFGLSPFTTAMARLMPTSMLKRASSPTHRSALYVKQMQSAPLIGIIAVRDRLDKQCCLLAGRLWQRAHLLATTRKIAARPCNEAIEIIDHERALAQPPTRLTALTQLIANANPPSGSSRAIQLQPNFLFLMGYPTLPAHPSPRHPIEDVEVSERATTWPDPDLPT